MKMLEMVLLLIATVLHILDRGIYFAQLVVYHLLICIRNARKLYSLLLNGTKTWIYMLGRLITFTVMLAPGWYHLLKYWFFDSFILRNIEYGKGAKYRNVMDIYLPLPMSVLYELKNDAKTYPDGAPVVIFVSGGAWIIGYKLWSALVGRALACFGILTIVPDYRNFPQGDIIDMTQDIRSAIVWTEANAYRFGGNPNKIILAGQSAGAHICLCLLVEEFLEKKQLERCAFDDYHDKLSRNYHVFDEMIGLGKNRSKTKRSLAPSSEKVVNSSSTASMVTSTLLSPSHVNVLDTFRIGATAEGRMDHQANDEFEVDEETEVETPSFQHYPIFPIKERQSLENLLLPSSGTKDVMVAVEHNGVVGTTAADRRESTEAWFRAPFNLEVIGGKSASTSPPPLESSMKLLPDQLLEKRNWKEGAGEEDDEWESSLMEDEKTVWREVNDEDLLHSAMEDSLLFHSRLTVDTIKASDISATSAAPSRSNFNDSNDALPPSKAKSNHSNYSSAPKGSSPPQNTSERLPQRQRYQKQCVSEKLRLFIGVSGPYNLQALEAHLHKRGLDSSILHWICRGNLIDYSPTVQLQQFVINELDKAASLEEREEREVTTTAYEVLPTSVAATATATASTTTATLDSVAELTASASATISGKSSSWFWNWSAMNFVRDEINLYFHKLFLHESLISFQFLDSNSRQRINSSDDVVVGRVGAGLSSRQLQLLQSQSQLLKDFVPIALFHGGKDASIPPAISEELTEVLSHHGAKVLYKLYPEWSHTDAILEAPLYGNTKLFKDMIRIIRQVTETSSFPASSTIGSNQTKRCDLVDRRHRSTSFPADSSQLLTKYSNFQLQHHLNRDHDNLSKHIRSSEKSNLAKPNPSETPLAPKFLLDFARQINPF